MNERRALTNVGGEVESVGDPAFTVMMERALRSAEGPADTLTHGFHSYPARMHPGIARTVLTEAKVHGGGVLDPFCGSGTVLVEAMCAGWRAFGSDLNPLAVRLARVKTERRSEETRKRFVDAAQKVAVASEARVRGRVPVRAALSREEVQWYAPHSLMELAGLWEEIKTVPDAKDRVAMELVFSSLVVKFSKQASDTSERVAEKKLRKGLPTEFFLRRSKELGERWADLDEALPAKYKRPSIVQSDARELPNTLGGEYHCDLVLSSPPYGGTYDYVAHHARRYPWLGISPSNAVAKEMGARRNLSASASSSASSSSTSGEKVGLWDDEVRRMLAVMSELLVPDGLAVLLVGDGQVGGQRIDAAEQLKRLAPDAGLDPLARASQVRVDWQGDAPRREHLVALLKG